MFSYARNRYEPKEDELRAALSVVDACLRAVVIYRPAWWALENPLNKLRRYLGPPVWSFRQWEYGDPADKRTALWGHFTPPMPRPGERTKPSTFKTHYQNADPKDGITPPHFAGAFFEANPLSAGRRAVIRKTVAGRYGPMETVFWKSVQTPLGSPASVAAAEASYLAARDARKAALTKKPGAIVGRGKTYEKRLQDATLKYLKTLPHVTAWKSGAGGFFSTYTSKKTGQTRSRFFRMGKKGCADIIGWVSEVRSVEYGGVVARFLALECKDPQGWPLTPAQREFLESVSKAGGLAKAVTSLEEVRQLLGDATP